MIGFDYTFVDFYTIYDSITLLTRFSIIDILILVLSLLLCVMFVLYIIPFTNIILNEIKTQRKKDKNKKMLRKIAFQKDIEDEIARELNLNS